LTPVCANLLEPRKFGLGWLKSTFNAENFICILKTVLEGKMEGKWLRGKPRRKMLDLLMEQEDKKISYEKLKRGAKSRVGWCHRHWNLP